jgi:tetratricopeptide (TPR) repeat protein
MLNFRRRAATVLLISVASLLAIGTARADDKGNAAKNAKKKPAKKAAPAPKVEAPRVNLLDLPELDFDAVPVNAVPAVLDPDETPEGQQRIREIEDRARTIFRDIDATMDKRRPFAVDRDLRLAEFNQAEASIIAEQQQLTACQLQAEGIRQQLSTPTTNRANLLGQLAVLNATISGLSMQIDGRVEFQKELLPQITALNAQMLPFDERLVKLWAELTECRKQWLEQRQPLAKYTRGEYELLRRVLDDWLVIDGFWQNAFAWASLCSYELGDSDNAAAYLDKAQKIPDGMRRTKRELAQLSALDGLVLSKQHGQTEKAKKAIARALRDADKHTAWETYFLVGRFYADRPMDLPRAKAHLDTALKIKPNCQSAQLWLARVQTIAASDKVRDLNAGIRSLEKLWDSTGRRSWRMAYFLFEALHRAGRAADAARFWEKAVELAPPERHEQLRLDREKLLRDVKAEKQRA